MALFNFKIMTTATGTFENKIFKTKINDEEYIIEIGMSKDKKNFIISAKSTDFSKLFFYKYESSFDELKALKYKYFKMFDTIEECIQDFFDIVSSKEANYIFCLNENNLLFQINICIGAKTENVQLNLTKNEISEKDAIATLSEKNNQLIKRVENLEKENEDLKKNNGNSVLINDILNEIKILKEEIFLSREIDSKIITSFKQINLIKSGINNSENKKIKFKLIFRGTRDGGKVSIFHKFCDGIPNTLSIIQTTKGYIFGGYNEKKWDSSSGCVTDPNAFIFSLDYMKVYKPKEGGTGYIHCASDHGPYFCGTTGMMDNYFTSNNHYEQDINNCYKGGEQNKPYQLNHGEKNFYGFEVEVFQILLI